MSCTVRALHFENKNGKGRAAEKLKGSKEIDSSLPRVHVRPPIQEHGGSAW